jgi:hypothetical protein
MCHINLNVFGGWPCSFTLYTQISSPRVRGDCGARRKSLRIHLLRGSIGYGPTVRRHYQGALHSAPPAVPSACSPSAAREAASATPPSMPSNCCRCAGLAWASKACSSCGSALRDCIARVGSALNDLSRDAKAARCSCACCACMAASLTFLASLASRAAHR